MQNYYKFRREMKKNIIFLDKGGLKVLTLQVQSWD